MRCLRAPILACAVLAATVCLDAQPYQPGPPHATGDAVSSAQAARATLDRYCVGCHNERLADSYGGLALDAGAVDLGNAGAHAAVLEQVVRRIRAGQMPPAGRPRPAEPLRESLAAWLESELDRAADAHPDPGRKEPFHRLNRAEYRNAVRDLLALDVDAAALLPPDDASYGFDNIAGVLRISQPQLERYLAAARKISREVLGADLPAPAVAEYRVAETQPQYDHIEGLPFGTRGGLLVRHHFPRDGAYEIAIDLLCRIQGECDGSVGFADRHELEVAIDGERVALFTLEPRAEFRPHAERTWRVRLPLAGGPHDVSVAFLKLPSIREADSRVERFLKPHYVTGVVGEPSQMIYQPFVDRVTIAGPFEATGAGDTPGRRAVLACRPASAADETACAGEILSGLMRRAFRRPVTAADVAALMPVYRAGREAGGHFEAGLEAALRRLLVSPEFLFRIERDPPGVAPATNYRIGDLELASRLSFFLWSSIPDDELLDVAVAGRLHEPEVLEAQVRRMLADERASSLVENFAGQWLYLRNIPALHPDENRFPDFGEGLRRAMQRETELFFESVMREDRSVLDLLTADYTFVNERLARHYGISNVYGSHFRRVTLPDATRRGLLGHGSILAATAYPTRTSPVLRGKWVLENLLGTPPPLPPPDVPSLEETTGEGQPLSMREAMEQHRANPVCSSCHRLMDPPGFALEQFDAVGKHRTHNEANAPIDASGILPDGTAFEGAAGLRDALLQRPDLFVTTLTEKLLTYALGRGVEHYDAPAIRTVVRDAERDGSRFSSIILGIVESVPFQMRRSAS